MDDLINRQVAIDAIRASASKYTGFMEMEMYTVDDAVEAINSVSSVQPKHNPDDEVEVEKVIAIIARLRSNRDANLIRYTSNEGKEIYVIRSQKDRGYFQALDDIEKSLLGRKEERK